MLQPLCIPNVYFWTHPGEPLPANAHLFVTQRGNVLIDPLPIDEDTHQKIDALGGVAVIVTMTAGRANASEEAASRYGAEVVAKPEHRQELFGGAYAVRLPDQRDSTEFAVSIPESRIVVVGDSLVGAPAGALSLPPVEQYADARKAALSLRRILRENLESLLVGRGQSLFAGAYAALYQLLYARAGAEVHRINVMDLDFRDERDESQPERYNCLDAEVGFAIGARKLGYRVSTLEPGHFFCPLHNHAREEELFFVLDGEPSVRTLSGTIRCRKGDFVAFPVGESGTHQLFNESDAPATVLLLARNEDVESCYYPDSDKLLMAADAPMAGGRRSMMVRGTPDLDYFDGEA